MLKGKGLRTKRLKAHSKCYKLDRECQPQGRVVREGLVKGLSQPKRKDCENEDQSNSINYKIRVAVESKGEM